MNKFLFGLIFSFVVLNAQTAEQIIDRHFAATGGEDAWNSLNSIVIDGEVTVDVSDVIDIKIEHKRPYFKRVSYIVSGKEQLSEGYDGSKAFTYNELNGKFRNLKGYTPDSFETDILNYKKKGFKAEFAGKEKLNGKDVYKIKLTKNTVVDHYYFDAATYQLLKEENPVETILYSDFKKVQGLTFAHRMESLPVGGKEYVVVLNKISPNAVIPDNRFVFDE